MKVSYLFLSIFIGFVSLDLAVVAVQYTFHIEEYFDDETLGLLKETCPQYSKFDVTSYEDSDFKPPADSNGYFANGNGLRCSQTESLQVTNGSEIHMLFSALDNLGEGGSLLVQIIDADYHDVVIKSEEIKMDNLIEWTWKSWTLYETGVIKIRITSESLDFNSYWAIDKLLLKINENIYSTKSTIDPNYLSKKFLNEDNVEMEKWKIITIISISVAGINFISTLIVSLMLSSKSKKAQKKVTYQKEVVPEEANTAIPRLDYQKHNYLYN